MVSGARADLESNGRRKGATMKRIAIAGLIALAGGVGWSAAARAQQPKACLHGTDESAANRARRVQAVGLIRAISNAEVQTSSSAGAFAPLAFLSGLPATPDGFTVTLSADLDGYALLMTDSTDPCRYTLFTNQNGLIYVGAPLQ
jgi:hypothetical protein